jgi:hypothetical protein
LLFAHTKNPVSALTLTLKDLAKIPFERALLWSIKKEGALFRLTKSKNILLDLLAIF